MAEQNKVIRRSIRHRDRVAQVPIYLGKLLRSFIYMNDWKVLPMSGVVAALVAMVVSGNFFKTMEGSTTGSFALTMVCIWNGCFNSIQSICRERSIVKREHRSGMHVSAYVIAHMIYQALLCAAQTGITLYIMKIIGVKFPAQGLLSHYGLVDIGITVFLTTYAADMLALLISSVVHTTTAAMTVMPFVLILQLVFSGGGFFVLPQWASPMKNATISSYSIKAINTIGNYNDLDLVAIWNSVAKLRHTRVTKDYTVREVMDFISHADNPRIRAMRIKKIEQLGVDVSSLMDEELIAYSADYSDSKLGQDRLSSSQKALIKFLNNELALGKLVDEIVADPEAGELLEQVIHLDFEIKEILDLFGEENVREALLKAGSQASYNKDYSYELSNLLFNWLWIVVFILGSSFLTMTSLKFIDKDKR